MASILGVYLALAEGLAAELYTVWRVLPDTGRGSVSSGSMRP
jgi:hypothetical protein